MAAENAMGNKLPMFVIGKSQNPRCFKNVKFLPCYRNHQKSWIYGKLLEEWLRELDNKFDFEGKNVALLIDNYPAHSHIDKLKAIQLYFLAPNNTSMTQPMDQDVIRSSKPKQGKNLVRKNIQSAERRRKPFQNVSLSVGCTLDANNC